jgi:hypothetical protein
MWPLSDTMYEAALMRADARKIRLDIQSAKSNSKSSGWNSTQRQRLGLRATRTRQ